MDFKALVAVHEEALKEKDSSALSAISRGISLHKNRVVNWYNKNRKTWRERPRAATYPTLKTRDDSESAIRQGGRSNEGFGNSKDCTNNDFQQSKDSDSSSVQLTEEYNKLTEDSNELTEESNELTEESIKLTEVSNELTEESEESNELTERSEESIKLTEESNELTEESNELTAESIKLTEVSNELTEESEESNELTEKSEESIKLTEESNELTEESNELTEESKLIDELRSDGFQQIKESNDSQLAKGSTGDSEESGDGDNFQQGESSGASSEVLVHTLGPRALAEAKELVERLRTLLSQENSA